MKEKLLVNIRPNKIGGAQLENGKKKSLFLDRWPENLNAKCVFFLFFFFARC